MRKIMTQKDMQHIYDLPPEVCNVILGVVESLDANYGTERDENSDGGYVAVMECGEDLAALEEELGINLEGDLFPEYVQTIPTVSGQTYTNALILCNNEFAITLIMTMEITPQYLLEYISE